MINRLAFTISLTLVASPVFAQRADNNAVKEADDAFGTSVGEENIGLYNPYDVRGFSAIEAGNARLDGLYFDQQTDPSFNLIDRSTMRVGISAQGYPLPAPTGIVDYSIRRAGDRMLISPALGIGPWDSQFVEVDVQLPLLKDRLDATFGGSLNHDTFETGGDAWSWSTTIAPRWRPAEGTEFIPFFSRTVSWEEEAGPLIFVSGPHLPPRVKRGHFYGQRWTDQESVATNFGALASTELSQTLTLRAGLFRSIFDAKQGFADLFLDTDPDGIGQRVIIADPRQKFASTSGEMRLSKTFTGNRSRHVLHLVGRARDQDRRYGGSDRTDFGLSRIGVQVDLPKPQFTFGPQTLDHVRQATAAVSYEGRWANLVELSAGVQKSLYRKDVTFPGGAELQVGKDTPWLYSGAAVAHVSKKLVLYGSYTTGLEEGGVAPDNAINKDAAAPAIITKQWDAGLRYSIAPSLRVVAGVFDVRKPYYNLDQINFYRRLGEIRQRGVEVSLAGTPISGVSLVAGALFLKPRVTGEEVDAGRIGPKPVGQTDRLIIINADYELPNVKGVSLNVGITSIGDRVASSDNQLSIPARTVFDLAGRYKFKVGGAPATATLRLGNVFNKFGWRTNSSAVFTTNAQRRVSLTVAADL